jgi:hypothetical protein
MRSTTMLLLAILMRIPLCDEVAMAMGKTPLDSTNGQLAVVLTYENASGLGSATLNALIPSDLETGNITSTNGVITSELNLTQNLSVDSATWVLDDLQVSPNWVVVIIIGGGPLNGAFVQCPVSVGATPPATQLAVTINGTPSNPTITPSNCQAFFATTGPH